MARPTKKSESIVLSIRVTTPGPYADLLPLVKRAQDWLAGSSRGVKVDESAAHAWLLRQGGAAGLLSTNAGAIVAATAEAHLGGIAAALERGDHDGAAGLIAAARSAVWAEVQRLDREEALTKEEPTVDNVDNVDGAGAP